MIVNDWDAGDVTASDRAERALLGAIVLAPYLRKYTGILKPNDFRHPSRGHVFGAMQGMADFDNVLLQAELERQKLPHPPGMTGWADAIGRLLDEALVAEEVAPQYVRVIKESSLRRQMKAMGAGKPPSGRT